MEPTVLKFSSSLSSSSSSSFQLSLVVIIFFITSAVRTTRLPLQLENFNANEDSNRNYLQSAFQNATDPAVYQNFLRPSGNCRGHRRRRRRRDSNASKLSKNQPLNVNMSLELYNYATVNDLTSEYTFQFFLDLEWCDERLILNDNDNRDDKETDDKLDKLGTPTEERYSFIEGGQWHIDRIWRPSIFVANNEQAGSIDNDQQSSNMIRIDGRTGRIWLRKRKQLHIFCLMDFSLFPFDRQHCSVHFESNVDNSRHLRLNWGELFLDRNGQKQQRSSYQQDSHHFTYQIADKRNSEDNEEIIHNHGSFRTIGFQLVDIHLGSSIVSGLSGVNFSRCTFDFTLQREFAHHLMLAYLPSALIVAVSWTSFWLEITSPPARVLLGVTTMLALVTNFKLTRDQLPSISYLNVLDVWNLVCITFIALSLVEFAVVNFIYNTQKRRKVLRAIKGRSERYREAQNKAEGLFKVGSSGSPKDLLNQFLFHRQIQAHDVSAETLGKLASLNSKLMTRTAAQNSQGEQNFLTDREMLADEEISPNDTSSKRKDRSYTVVSFADGVQSSSGVDSSAKMPRKYTTTTSSSSSTSNGLLSPSTSNSASSSVPPVLKRVYSGESANSNTNTNTNNFPLTGSSRRGSTVSVQSDVFSANQRGRRKSLLISSSPEVPARFELTPEELAQRIDHWSRILFPAVFTLFNLLYWMSVFLRKAHSQAPKW